MNRTALNIILACVLAVIVAINWLGARDYRRPNYEFLPNMVRSVPYDTYSPNPNFPDGKTLQTPPPGTIPHGAPALSYGPTTQEALRAGEELANPVGADDGAALERGVVLYDRFCLPCHGPSAGGDGAVVKRGFPPPPPLFADRARQMKDGQIFHIITHGQGNMPAHAAQISPDDRWRIVLRVRQLQQSAAPAAGTTP